MRKILGVFLSMTVAASLLAGPVGGFILLGILVAVCRKLLQDKKSEEGR